MIKDTDVEEVIESDAGGFGGADADPQRGIDVKSLLAPDKTKAVEPGLNK